MSEVYDRYVDTAGNYHYTDVETGHHVIPCGYCHEDRDGYVSVFWASSLIGGLKKEWLHKTGKHYPIEEWMREMRGET